VKGKAIVTNDDLKEHIIRLEERQANCDSDIQRLFKRILDHMEKEEEAFAKLYNRLHAMEKELTVSFKERDSLIHALKMQQTTLVAYATSAFVVMTIVEQVLLRLM